jgi:hypothetical protein
MNTQKFIVSGIVGGIVSFVAGYFIYGMLLMNYMNSHPGLADPKIVNRSMSEMVWWALILGNIFSGLTLSYIYNKWANITTLAAGAKAGAALGLLMILSFDLSMYGTSNLLSKYSFGADVVGFTVLTAITGAAVGWANGWGKKA